MEYIIENGVLKNYYSSAVEEDLYPVVPDGVKRIGGELLENDCHNTQYKYFYEPFSCELIKSLVLPEGVEIIGKFSLFHCRSLSRLEIPRSLTIIEYAATEKCDIDTIVYNGTILDLEKIKVKPCNGNFHKIICSDVTLNLDNEFFVDELPFNGTIDECKQTMLNRWVYRRARIVHCNDGDINNSDVKG